MLIDYFIENKIAIEYSSREEGEQVNAFFSKNNYPTPIEKSLGYLTHFKEVKNLADGFTFTSEYHAGSAIYLFDGYTIITAAEFFNMVSESNNSIIDGMQYA